MVFKVKEPPGLLILKSALFSFKTKSIRLSVGILPLSQMTEFESNSDLSISANARA
jgi:hypothetical protein